MKTKKIIAALLSSAMVLGTLAVPVMAENEYAAEVNGNKYTTLMSAVDAAQTGDTVTVIANIKDEAITVNKMLTITGAADANNVTINAITGCEELTVTGLTFTGNSWINSGEANKLTVSDVTANVTPVNGKSLANGGYTNSRSGFISLGRNEGKQLDLIVKRCNIVVKRCSISASDDNPDSIIGWAAVKNVTIEGNTFGSETAPHTGGDAVKFMAIADGAEFAITGNTVYSSNNGFVFGQNTTRNNAYTVVIDKNTFMGKADHIWIEVTDNNNATKTTHAKILATSDNTVNGDKFKVDDIKVQRSVVNWTGYAGVDVVLDENKKITGGTFRTDPHRYVSVNYASKKLNSSSNYTVIPLSQLGSNLDGELTIKSAIDNEKYEQVSAATVTISDINSSYTKEFKVTAKDKNGNTVEGVDGNKITLQNIIPGTKFSGETNVLCGIIITDIPEGCTVTVE